jgi:hypothetical protein
MPRVRAREGVLNAEGAKGPTAPADVIGNAVRVMEIATGQRDEEYDPEPAKDDDELGWTGGAARAERMTPQHRKAAARTAAAARWAKSLAPSEGE